MRRSPQKPPERRSHGCAVLRGYAQRCDSSVRTARHRLPSALRKTSGPQEAGLELDLGAASGAPAPLDRGAWSRMPYGEDGTKKGCTRSPATRNASPG